MRATAEIKMKKKGNTQMKKTLALLLAAALALGFMGAIILFGRFGL